ncbi:hypothetical protein [Zobellia russellii]|uniref:hypothetical protein n=3 Tax=Zobellia TaxID=112040 RepID=UPI0037DC2C7E
MKEEILKPTYIKNPDFVTGKKDKIEFYDFDCLSCENKLKLNYKVQIENSWTGKTENISEQEYEGLKKHYNIGLSQKSKDGGFPVFDKIVCSKCLSEYYTYVGVDEFSNSAYFVQVQGIMCRDKILFVEIDEKGKLNIRPYSTTYPMIYRSATEVHWDKDKKTLYSPKPTDWSYLEWYLHILSVIKTECSVILELTDKTEWVNIGNELRAEITKAQQNL